VAFVHCLIKISFSVLDPFENSEEVYLYLADSIKTSSPLWLEDRTEWV
jgi:hypothetical protein